MSITTDLFESLLFLSQSVVLSSELLNIQRRQPGSILKALLHPLLHTDEDKNKNREHIMQTYYCVFVHTE